MSYFIIILMSAAVLMGLFVWHKISVAQREIEQLFRTNQALEAKVRQQAVEIQQKNTEVKNAHIAQQARNIVNRSSHRSIDEQLHAKGYFRDDGYDHRLSGVQPDLSESCRHDGDETADSCSQSDL